MNKNKNNIINIPFTNIKILSKYVTESGRILPRKITRLRAKEQRHITRMIKRARNMLLMQ